MEEGVTTTTVHSGSGVTIAVLPFENLSGQAEQEYFARGFVEDLITDLSRFPALEVIHPRTSFALDPAGAKAGVAGRKTPQVGYWLRGSVRRLDDTLRITAQLVEAESGRQVWGDRYDAPVRQALEIQDEISSNVAGALAVKIDNARLGHARRKEFASLEAYDCWLRGMDHLRRGTIADDARARQFFERALALDPNYARAHAGVSLSYFNEWSCQAWERWDENEQRAFAAARHALALDETDAVVHVVLARIHLYRREFAQAEHHLERALALNPNDADILAQAGLCRAYLGDGEDGLALARKAIRLNPFHDDWYLGCLALSLFILRRNAEGIEVAVKAPRATVDLPAYLAGGYARLGDSERASTHVATFLADFTEKITFGRTPEPGEPLRWILHVNPFRHEEDAEYLAESLRWAGLPSDPDAGRLATSATPSPDPADRAVFQRGDGVWTIQFVGLAAQLTEVKGFHDLAVLLARPAEEIHCLELAGRPAEGTGDSVLDAQAQRNVRSRIRDLQTELDEAEALHDLGRAEHARAELDQLVEGLANALGIGGRSRKLGSGAERARCTVTWRIRNAIRKIASAHPRLGQHLDNAVRTGTFCAYTPETPVDWLV
jgi:TolB-like protein